MKKILNDFWIVYGMIAIILFGGLGYFFDSSTSQIIGVVYFFLTMIYLLKEHKQDWVQKYMEFVKNDR